MKRLINSLIGLGLLFGLILAACSQDEAVENLQKQKAAAIEENETRTGGAVVRCEITTTEKGQVNTLIDEWAAKNDIPRVAITHLRISGPINKADIETTCAFQILDSLMLQDAKLDTLPSYSFQNFKSEAAIILPNSLTRIENNGCYNCNAKSIYVPDGVEYIGSSAFYLCSKLQEVHLPKNLTTIESNTFYNCSSLTSIELPDYVINMGRNVFQDCSSLETVKWPVAVVTIPDYTFSGCTKLKFTIPDHITSIGDYAFSGCKAITEFKLPASVKNVGDSAFRLSGITSVTLTTDTLTVSPYQFAETPVTSITLNEGIDALPEGLFYGCSNLESVSFPSSYRIIPLACFSNCPNLKNVSLNEGLRIIGSEAFSDSGLTSVTLPSSVRGIDEYAFSGCKNLISLTLNEGLCYIGTGAFKFLPITSLSIPSSVGIINSDAFLECKQLKSIVFNEGLSFIDSYAFAYNEALTSVSLPTTLTTISRGAFAYCYMLNTLTLKEGLTSIGSSAFASAAITSLTLPSTVTKLGEYSFSNNSNLKEIILNEGLKSIGHEAFAGSQITSLTIPSTVVNCETGIVSKCSKLTSVFWNSPTEAPQFYSISDSNVLLYLNSGTASTLNSNVIKNGKSTNGIILKSGGNFHCPQAFTTNIKYEKSFTCTSGIGEAAGWKTIILPFDVQSIKCGDDVLAPFGAEVAGAKRFWLRELTADGFVRATKIEANKPYIIAMPNNSAYDPQYIIKGTVTFSAENVTIPVTEALQPSIGKTFDLYGTYEILEKSDERLVLNTNYYTNKYDYKTYMIGAIFIGSTNQCATFEAYAKSKTGTRAIPLSDYVTTRAAKTLGSVPMEDDM